MASLAGFCCLSLSAEDSEYKLPVWEAPAEEEAMDMADEGRTKGAGEVERRPNAELLRAEALLEPPQVSGEKRESEEGCWRTQNTKVLLMTRRLHWG